MPLYEYECEKCGHRFEVIQKFSDPPEKSCPVCAGAVRKLLSSPAIQFKGTGWYITDYSKKGAPPAGEAGKPGETKPAEASSTKTETSEASKSTDSSTTPPASKKTADTKKS